MKHPHLKQQNKSIRRISRTSAREIFCWFILLIAGNSENYGRQMRQTMIK